MAYQYCLIPRSDCVSMGKDNSTARNATVIESMLDAIGVVSAVNTDYNTNPEIFGIVFDYLKSLNKCYIVTYNGSDYLLGAVINIPGIIQQNAQNILCVPMEMINDTLTYIRQNMSYITTYNLAKADFEPSGFLPDIFDYQWGIYKTENVTFPPVEVANALQIAHTDQTFYPIRCFDSTLTADITEYGEDSRFQLSAEFRDGRHKYADYDYFNDMLTDSTYGKNFVGDYNDYVNSLTPPTPQPTESVVIGLVNAYNPDGNGMLEFARWVWTTDAFSQNNPDFKNPINAILGTRLIYVKPDIKEAKENILVGTFDSNVTSDVCNNMFKTVDCGSVFIEKKYDNVHDFRDVVVTLYLPFIGYNTLETALVMGKQIHVTYKVNILNGDCVAYVNIIEDTANPASQLETYTYSGNMGVSIPINGSVSNMSDVDLNNPLAMLSHIPYVDVVRPIPYEPTDKNKYEGLPCNDTVVLGTLTGYTKCKSVFIEGLTATNTEIEQIKQLLESGVIL